MPFYWATGEIPYLGRLERFAALVAAAEREACAQLCEDRDSGQDLPRDLEDRECAIAIRARGQE